MSNSIITLGSLIKPAMLRRAGSQKLPILSMTMRHGLVDQGNKFKKRVASQDTSSYKIVARGQLVVGFPIDEAVLSFQEKYDEAIVSPAYEIWDVSDPARIDRAYLERFLRSPRAIAYYAAKLQGTTARRRSLPRDVFLALQVVVPDLSEQRRIAQVLDHVDALRAKRREAIALLDDLAQSIFLDMFGDPMKDQNGWKVATVAEAGVVQLGRQRAPKYQSGKYSRLYMRVANVYEDRIDLSDVLSMDFDDADFEKYRLLSGDILLNEGQSTELVGRPAMWRDEIEGTCFQNTLVRFQADPEVAHPDYSLGVFLRYFRTGEFAKISSKTSNVAHLGAARFARMPFPLPPLPLQSQYAARISTLNELKTAHAAHLAELDALFASLQHRAFRGELWSEAPSPAA